MYKSLLTYIITIFMFKLIQNTRVRASLGDQNYICGGTDILLDH